MSSFRKKIIFLLYSTFIFIFSEPKKSLFAQLRQQKQTPKPSPKETEKESPTNKLIYDEIHHLKEIKNPLEKKNHVQVNA